MDKAKLRTMVETVLSSIEATRNDDITLTTEIWKRYYPELLRKDALGFQFVYLKSLHDLPREDNVKRIRAKLQNEENKFLPTDEKVRKNRKISEEQWHTYLGYATRNPNQTELEVPKAVDWNKDE